MANTKIMAIIERDSNTSNKLIPRCRHDEDDESDEDNENENIFFIKIPCPLKLSEYRNLIFVAML